MNSGKDFSRCLGFKSYFSHDLTSKKANLLTKVLSTYILVSEFQNARSHRRYANEDRDIVSWMRILRGNFFERVSNVTFHNFPFDWNIEQECQRAYLHRHIDSYMLFCSDISWCIYFLSLCVQDFWYQEKSANTCIMEARLVIFKSLSRYFTFYMINSS